jgi:uncharacterized repeat protein (TIGR04076 family)
MPRCDLYESYDKPISLKGATKNTCRFHKAPQKFSPSEVGPAGLCPEIYYLAYPYLFAEVYGAKLTAGEGRRLQFTCPNADTRLMFEVVHTQISLYDRMKNMIKIAISRFLHMAMMHCGIDLKLVDLPQLLPPACPHSLAKTGDVYHINFGLFNNLCPAAFRSVFPYYAVNFLRNKGGRPLLTDLVACPDHKKHLMFDISNNCIGKNDKSSEEICHATDDINIQMIKKDSVNPAMKEIFSIGDIMKGLNFPCPMLLNVGIPYYLTLYHGGKLGFYTYNHKSAIIQCPNTKGRVSVEVILEDSNVVFKILDAAGEHTCPHDIKPGENYLFSVDDKNRAIMEKLNLLIFYSVLAKETADPIIVENITDQSKYKIARLKNNF